MTYAALCRWITVPANIEYWVTILDKPVHRLLQAGFGTPWRQYAQEERLPEKERRLRQLPYNAVRDPSSGRPSNASRPDFADVTTWYKHLKQNLPEQYALLWGDK